MIFNSLSFFLFLATVLLGYYMLPHKYRWMLILLASYFFYGFWKIEYLSLIVISTTIDFFAAKFIYQNNEQYKKRIGLAISLASNLGMLMFFKYSGWFLEDVLQPIGAIKSDHVGAFHRLWDFVLPVGISFYTFQTMGYTIDVYHGNTPPEKNPFKFALFVSYFPQLVAGPIERFSQLHQQLFQRVEFNYHNIQHGGRNILYGLFIKMCVADNISPVVDQLFGAYSEASAIQLFMGMVLFGIQIYSDFHGYSLIAIGTARLFGVRLMDNFNAPYSATSIREFWSKWHISLSTWFRDYLYIPLGGNRSGSFKKWLNILVVFLVSGLWHGANWTFVVWGAMHGAAYMIEQKFTTHSNLTWLRPLRWLLTILVVFVAWIFFRSSSVADSIGYLQNMVMNHGGSIDLIWNPIIISFTGLFVLSDFHFRNRSFHLWIQNKPGWQRWLLYAFLLYSITGFAGTVNHPFIYFQF